MGARRLSAGQGCRSPETFDGWIDEPTLENIHFQRFFEMSRQAINARLAIGGRTSEFVRGR
jgi:hypothetical protein